MSNVINVVLALIALFVLVCAFAVHPILGIGLACLMLGGMTSGGSGGSTGQGRDYW